MFSKQNIVNYISQRHLSDGGYFFARVEPSSQLETYLAIKTLRLLNSHSIPRLSILSFWQNEKEAKNIDSVSSLFLAIKSFKILKEDTRQFQSYAPMVLAALNSSSLLTKKTSVNSNRKPVNWHETGVSTLSLDFADNEAKGLYQLTATIKDLDLKPDLTKLISFIYKLQNNDGGYGHIRGSHLPTTFYALKILHLLKRAPQHQSRLINYLSKQFNAANYLEEYFWSTRSLRMLKQPILDKDQLLEFITKCHKGNGGFARSKFMGIANIEQTHQAVSLLKLLKEL